MGIVTATRIRHTALLRIEMKTNPHPLILVDNIEDDIRESRLDREMTTGKASSDC
jgi:hypothetical protein